jgi:hypothetical protein
MQGYGSKKDKYVRKYNFLKEYRALLSSIDPLSEDQLDEWDRKVKRYSWYTNVDSALRRVGYRYAYRRKDDDLIDYMNHFPNPTMYHDCVVDGDAPAKSERFTRDIEQYHEMYYSRTRSNQTLPFIMFKGMFLHRWFDHYDQGTGKATVGEIQLVPKTGTVGYRPIGNANKFYQWLLAPLSDYLYDVLKEIPEDCTHDQGKFDSLIQERVDRGEYIASVDLSKATDYMPFEFFFRLMEDVKLSTLVEESFWLYRWFCDQEWSIGPWTASWKRGQALGTKPSFAVMGITHHAILQLLQVQLHLPTQEQHYVILGDDLLVFNKALRDAYVEFMASLGSPLSLHKSYENRLVEFAGKMFIRNNSFAYNTDHNAITWNTLFDWQKSTRERIPWDRLPNRLQKRWRNGFESYDKAKKWYEACSYSFTNQVPPDDVLAEVAAVHILVNDPEYQPERALDPGVQYFEFKDRVFINPSHEVIKQPLSWYDLKYHKTATDVVHMASVGASTSSSYVS